MTVMFRNFIKLTSILSMPTTSSFAGNFFRLAKVIDVSKHTNSRSINFAKKNRSSKVSVLKMSKKALVFLAPGSEEIEFTVSVDVLRRAGVNVFVAGVQDNQLVKCSRDVKITPDIHINDAEALCPFDAIVLPGGLGGSKAMAESLLVGKLLKQQEEAGRIVAAICAAPIALKSHKIYHGKSLTSYPSVEQNLTEGGNYNYKSEKVVVDGPLITSRGPGTAFQFALTIVDQLVGKEKASEVAKGMLLEY